MIIKNLTDNVIKAFYRHIKANVGNLKGMEVTQAQYDALSEQEKNNGTIYFITDSNEGVLSAIDVGLQMIWKGETTSAALPTTSDNDDFYFLTDMNEGRIYRGGKWVVVR